MTNEQRNMAQDLLDGLLRDAYSRGFMDATNDQKIKPINETMTTYNLLILDKMIQHHYETDEVIRPTQEEVENALNSIMWDIRELEEQNKEMFAIIKSLVVNRRIIADSHFEGVRERLIDMAETIVNKVNGEK